MSWIMLESQRCPGWCCDGKLAWEGPLTLFLFLTFLPCRNLVQRWWKCDILQQVWRTESKWACVCVRVETQAHDSVPFLLPICFPIINFFQCPPLTPTQTYIYATHTQLAFLLYFVFCMQFIFYTHADLKSCISVDWCILTYSYDIGYIWGDICQGSKISPEMKCWSRTHKIQNHKALRAFLAVFFRTYKVRFNSVSSYSDTRKSSSDEPEPKANFESTGALANIR